MASEARRHWSIEKMREWIAWVAAVLFVVVACIPDPLPFVDEIILFLVACLSEHRVAGIVAIIVIIALWYFGVWSPEGLK